MRRGIPLVPFLVGATTLSAQSVSLSPLVRLPPLSVVVESLPAAAAQLGLVPSQIQTDTELRLRQAGVRVLAGDVARPMTPYLYVNINAVSYEPQGLYGYTVEVKLQQPVVLPRRGEALFMAATWSARGSIGLAPLERVASRIRESISDQLSQFLNEWLAENPRR